MSLPLKIILGEFFKTFLGVAAMTKMSAEQILKAMEEMEFDERIKLLKTLGEKHFGLKEKSIEEIRRLNYEAMYGDEDED